MSKLVSWSFFFCLPCAAVRAEDAGDAKAREAVNQFVKALRAKDAAALAKVAAVPFFDDKDNVVKDAEKLGKLLREKADKLELPEGAEVTTVVPYAEMRGELHDGPRRKRMEEVLGKNGRIVLLTEKKHQWMRAVLVRLKDGKAVVVGGPHLFGYLMDNKIPEAARTLLEKAERLELLSLDPDFKKRGKPETGFHGWRILGRTSVKEPATRKKLVMALLKGVEESDGNAARCFNPRHGIRVTHDSKTADFVICFECLQTEVYMAGKGTRYLTTASPQQLFDKILRAAKVPLAPKAKE